MGVLADIKTAIEGAGYKVIDKRNKPMSSDGNIFCHVALGGGSIEYRSGQIERVLAIVNVWLLPDASRSDVEVEDDFVDDLEDIAMAIQGASDEVYGVETRGRVTDDEMPAGSFAIQLLVNQYD